MYKIRDAVIVDKDQSMGLQIACQNFWSTITSDYIVAPKEDSIVNIEVQAPQ